MSISKIVVSGRVVRAPEKRFTANSNVPVTEFSIAVESPARPDGSVETQAIKVIAWRDLAERVAQEVKKGDLVAVDGRLQINSFSNSEGQRRRDAEIDASNVENLSNAVANGGNTAITADEGESRSFAKVGANAPAKPANKLQNDDIDAIFASEDEIPF